MKIESYLVHKLTNRFARNMLKILLILSFILISVTISFIFDRIQNSHDQFRSNLITPIKVPNKSVEGDYNRNNLIISCNSASLMNGEIINLLNQNTTKNCLPHPVKSSIKDTVKQVH